MDGHLLKVVAEDAANILGHAVVGHDVDHQPAPNQQRNALQQETLLIPAAPAFFRQDRQIGWVEKNGVKSSVTDIGAKKAAKAHPVQQSLGLFRPAAVQLYAIAEAVVPGRHPLESRAGPAAGIQQIDGHVMGKCDSPGDQLHMVRVGGIVPHADVVHQPPDDGGVGGLIAGQTVRKLSEHRRQLAVIPGHQLK